MNLADQAAHAIVIAARKMGVDPISVLLRNLEPTTAKVYARNTAAALLAKLPDWNRRSALDALGVSTDERYLENLTWEIEDGRIRWITAEQFSELNIELAAVVCAEDGSDLSRPPITGLLDIIYGIEDVTG